MTTLQFDYKNDDHYNEIKLWCRKRGVACTAKDYLPFYGLIVPGIAAGFLRMDDVGAVCYVDEVITNPDVHKKERREALKEVMEGLQKEAKRSCKVLIGFTQSPTLIDIWTDMGAQNKGPYIVLVKEM